MSVIYQKEETDRSGCPDTILTVREVLAGPFPIPISYSYRRIAHTQNA